MSKQQELNFYRQVARNQARKSVNPESQLNLEGLTEEEKQEAIKEAHRKTFLEEYEEEQAKEKKWREANAEAIAQAKEYNRQIKEAQEFKKQMDITEAAVQSSNWFSNLTEGMLSNSKLAKYKEEDGKYYKRKNTLGIFDRIFNPGLSIANEKRLSKEGMSMGEIIKSTIANTILPSLASDVTKYYDEVPAEELGEVMTDIGEKRALSDAYNVGQQLNKAKGDFAKQSMYDLASSLAGITKTIGSGELKGAQRNALWQNLKKNYHSANLGIQQILNNDENLVNAHRSKMADAQIDINKSEEELKKQYEIASEKGEVKTGWENFIDKTLGFEASDKFFDQQTEWQAMTSHLAAQMEGRETKEFLDSKDAEPLNEGSLSYSNDETGESYTIPMERYPEGSENNWDIEIAVRNDDGSVKRDENGTPIYIPKYSWADKIKGGNYYDLFTDKYASENLTQGIVSSASFLAAGPGIGKGVGAVGKALTKGANYTEKTLGKYAKEIAKLTPLDSKALTGNLKFLEGSLERIEKLTPKALKGEQFAASVAQANAKSQQLLNTVANSYLMTNTESQMIGKDVENQVYRNHILKEMDIDEDDFMENYREENPEVSEINQDLKGKALLNQKIKEFEDTNPEAVRTALGLAGASRQLTVSINNLNTLSNLNYGAYFTKATKFSRRGLHNPFSKKGLLYGGLNLIKEGGQEYFEEGYVNQYSELAAVSIAKGDVLSLNDFIESGALSAESITSGVIGGLTGFGQSAVMQGISSRGSYKDYKKSKQALEEITNLSDFSNENIAKFLGVMVDSQEVEQYIADIEAAEERGDIKSAKALSDKLLLNKAIRAATSGVMAEYNKHLTSMLSSEDLDADSKQKITEAISFNNMVADVYDTHASLVGANNIAENRANYFIQDRVIKEMESLLPEYYKAYEERLDRQARQGLKDVEIDGSMSYADLLNQRKLGTTLHSNTKEAKQIKEVLLAISHLEDNKSKLDENYEYLTSEKGQKQEAKKLEQYRYIMEVAAANKKNAQETKSKLARMFTFGKKKNKVKGKANNDIDKKVYEEKKPNPVTSANPPNTAENSTTIPTQEIIDEAIPDSIYQPVDAQSLLSDDEVATEGVTQPADSAPKSLDEEALAEPLFAPVKLDPEKKAHNEKVKQLEEGIAKILEKNPTVNFDGLITGLRSRFGGTNTEQLYEFLAKAWENVTKEKFDKQALQDVYNAHFADTSFMEGKMGLNSIPEGTTESTTQELEQTEKESFTEGATLGVDPLTGEVKKIYHGFKINDPLVKVAMLGLNYEVSEDGEVYRTISNTINPTAFPGLHWENFRPGSKVELRFNFDYLLDANNPMRLWTENDTDAPIADDLTTKEMVELIFGEGTYADVARKLKTKEGQVELLQNEDFLKIVPTGFMMDGEMIDLGINDYHWWNARNTALEIDANTGAPLIERRSRLIKAARKNNLDTRRQMAINPDMNLMMTVADRRPGYQNELLEEDKQSEKLNTVAQAFKGNREAAKANTGFGVVIGKAIVSQTEGKKNTPVVNVGGQRIALSQIINMEAFLKIKGDDSSGKLVMVKPVGFDKEGRKIYTIHHTITNHSALQAQFEIYGDIFERLRKFGFVLTRGDAATPETRETIRKVAKFFREEYGIDITDSTMFTKFENFYPEWRWRLEERKKEKKDPNYVSNMRYRQDYDVRDHNNSKVTQKIPDIRGMQSVEEFLEAVVNGTLTSTTAHDILLDNVHTPLIFTEITSPSHESIWSSESQPIISFDNSHLTEDVRKQKESEPKMSESAKQLQATKNTIEDVEDEVARLKESLRQEEDARRKKSLETQIKNAENEAKKLEKRKKVLEGIVNTQKEGGKEGNTETETQPKKVRKPQPHDIIDLNYNVLFEAFSKIDLTKPFSKESLLGETIKEAFEKLVDYVRENGTPEELNFILENRNTILGTDKYDGSVRELLDNIFNLDVDEDFNLDETENIKDYNKESYERDIRTSLSDRVKILFSGIRDPRTSKGFAGLQSYMPYSQSVAALQQILSQTSNNTLEEIKLRIKEKVDLNPEEFGFYEEMLKRLEELEGNEKQLLNEVLYNLNQPKTEMAFMVYSSSASGGFTIQRYDANSRNPEIATKQKWGQYFKDSSLVERFEEGLYNINRAEADKINEYYASIKLNLEEGNIDMESLHKFLEAFGIMVSPETLKAMAGNLLGSAEISLYTEGMVTIDNRQEKSGQVFGILAPGQLLDVLKKNLDTALRFQDMGKVLDDNGRISLVKVRPLLAGNKELAKAFRAEKTFEDKERFIREKIADGTFKDLGKVLSFADRFVYDADTQQSFNALTTNNTGALGRIIKAHNIMTFTPDSSMRIAGKPINAYQQPKRITNILKKLQRDKKFMAELSDLAINDGSFLIEALKSNPELKEYIDVINMSLESLKKFGNKSRDDMEITKLSDKDAFITLFNMFAHSDGDIESSGFEGRGLKLRKGVTAFPTLSDSSQMPLLKTALIDLQKNNFKVSEEGMEGLSEEFLTFFTDAMVRGDLKRITDYARAEELRLIGEKIVRKEVVSEEELNKAFAFFNQKYDSDTTTETTYNIGKKLAQKVNVKGHNAGANFITSITSLGSLMLETTDVDGNPVNRPLIEVLKYHELNGKPYRDNIDLFLENYKKEIHAEVERNINKEVEAYISEDGKSGLMIDNEIYVNGELRFIDGKYLKSKEGLTPLEKARLVAYDYVINNMIQLKDIQNIFASDVANYFKDKMGANLEFGMPSVDVKDILDYYYSDISAEQRKEILDNADDLDYIESIAEDFPKLLSAKSISLNETEQRIADIMPIAEGKVKDIMKDVQNNLSKRLKSAISPGLQFPNSQGNQKYYQIMLADVDSASEVMKSIIDYFYPGVYETVKDDIIEFKALDNIYRADRTDEQQDRYDKLYSKLENKIPNSVAFLKTAMTDAQEYTTWKDNLQQLKEVGTISEEEYKAIYKKFEAQANDIKKHGFITEENKWQPEEADLKAKSVMQTSKPLYSGVHFEEVNGYKYSRELYIKSSSFPLIPELTAMFPKLEMLRRNMESLESDGVTVRASYDSANKVGAVSSPLSINELYQENPNLDKLAAATVELDRENFFIQQDKPYDPQKVEITRTTQFEKIILGDGMNKIPDHVFPSLFDDTLLEELGVVPVDGKLNGPQLKQIYDGIYQKEQKLLTDRLFKRFGIKSYGDIARGEPKAMEEIVKILKGRLDNKQDKEALQLSYVVDVDGKKTIMSKAEAIEAGLTPEKAMFKFPLHMMPNSQKLESVLNSVVNKSNIRLKNAGFSSPVGSQEGFDHKSAGKREYSKELYEEMVKKGAIFTPAFNPEVGLTATTNIKSKKLQSAQVFVQNKFRVRNEETGEIETLNLRDYLDADGKLDLPQDLLSMFSFRIPTSSHQSGVNIEIAGILPDEMGDLMIVPKDHTAQIGEDYDIDTRYVYNYHLIKKTDGTVKRLQESDLDRQVTPFREADDELNKLVSEVFLKMNTIKDNASLRVFVESNQEALIELAIYVDSLRNYEEKAVNTKIFLEEGEEALTKDEIVNRIARLKDLLFPQELEDVLAGKINIREEGDKIIRELSMEMSDNSEIKNALKRYRKSSEHQKRQQEILQNNLTSLYKTVYSSTAPEVQTLINKVLTTERAESTAGAMDKKISLADETAVFNIFSPTVQRKVLRGGAYGKIGIGEHSNAVTMNSLFQQSEHSHRLVRSYDKEGNPIFYNIQLGPNLRFDGVMGKIEVNGVRVSELGMESQNSATDNQKLEIMDRRNENSYTMTVLKILQANGIDNDNILVDGKSMSYSSLFLNQPILRAYAKAMDKFSSETSTAFGKDSDLTQVELLEKFGKGLEAHWAVDATTGETMVGTLSNEAKKKAGQALSSLELWNNLLDKDAQPLIQWYVYETFRTLQGAAKSYNDLQQFINIERSGLGKSYFDTIALMDKLETLARNVQPDITNQEKMIGNSQFVKHDTEFAETAKDLESKGYIRVRDLATETLFILPSNHYSHKIVNSITLGYNLYNSLFPYDHPIMQSQIDSIMATSNVNPDSKEAIELKYQIVRELKDYVYSNSRYLFGGDTDSHVQSLFFDRQGENQSLASYLLGLKKSEEFSDLFYTPFFQDLKFDINEKSHPSIISFNNSDISKLNTLDIYNSLKRFVGSTRELAPRNGQKYTEGQLMDDLLRYSLLANQENGAIGFRQHLPIELFETNGVTENISSSTDANRATRQNIIYNGVYKSLESLLGSSVSEDGRIKNTTKMDPSAVKTLAASLNATLKGRGEDPGTLVVTEEGDIIITNYTGENFHSVFVKQFIQHNPDRAVNIGKFIIKNDPQLGLVKTADKSLRGILNANKVKAKDVKDMTSFYYEAGPSFVQIADPDGNIMLFENTAKDYYERIDTLGTFGFNEYQAGIDSKKSKVKKNNTTPIQKGTQKMFYPVTKDIINEKGAIDEKGKNRIPELLTELLDDPNGTYAPLFEMISPFVAFDKISMKVSNLEGGNARYNPATRVIEISDTFLREEPTKNELLAAIAEELIHDVTSSTFSQYIKINGITKDGRLSYDILQNEDGTEIKLPSELLNLISIYNYAFQHIANKQGMEALQERISSKSAELSEENFEDNLDAYRVKNIHEFVAGIFLKDESFAQEMAVTPYRQSGKNILEKFADALAALFNRVLPNKRKDTVSYATAHNLYNFLRDHHIAKQDITQPVAKQEVKPFSKRSNNVINKANEVVAGNRDTQIHGRFLNVRSSDPVPGTLVEYNGEEYLYWGDSESGQAQLIGEDGTKFSGTPNLDKLKVIGKYPIEVYSGTGNIIVDEFKIYSVATGKRVYSGNDSTSVNGRESILNQMKERGRKRPTQPTNTSKTRGKEIYSKLGEKTVSENVVIIPWKELKSAKKAISSSQIVATRIFGTEEHFGNPFSSEPEGKTKGLIRTRSVQEAVEKYIDWILGSEEITKEIQDLVNSEEITLDYADHLSDRAAWIRSQIESNKLKQTPIAYYKELGEPSHATALDALINSDIPVKKPVLTQPTTTSKTIEDTIVEDWKTKKQEFSLLEGINYDVDTNLVNKDKNKTKRLASTNGEEIKVNPVETIEEFYDYITGKTQGETSAQKKKVIEVLEDRGFTLEDVKRIITDVDSVTEFLVRHEQDHIDNNDKDVYWKNGRDLLTDDKIEIEVRATYIALLTMMSEEHAQEIADRKSIRPTQSTAQTSTEFFNDEFFNDEYFNEMEYFDGEEDFIDDFDARYRDNSGAQNAEDFLGSPSRAVIKDGVTSVFEENSELANIGTQEEYSNYLDSIFPDSKIKDIVYHATDKKFEEFKVGQYSNSIFFAPTEKEAWTQKGDIVVKALINSKNPLIIRNDKYPTESQKKYDSSVREYDIDYINSLPEEVQENGELFQEISVDNPNQIHILGSKQDIEGFKDYKNILGSPSRVNHSIKANVILPIGTSGSGKSTFIKSLPQENLAVIEPDAMRVEFTGDMNDKSKDKEIYIEAANRAIQAIKQGKQVVFDTTNLTKDKRLPFIEAIKKAIPTASIQYKLMELDPELAKQRIKAQLKRGENRANVSDATIDRHAESYKQMLEDIKNEPIIPFIDKTESGNQIVKNPQNILESLPKTVDLRKKCQ